MDAPPRSSAAAAGSGSSAAYTAEIAESLRFEEEIQSLMRDNTLIHPSLDPAPPPPPPPPPSSSSAASSFTALLGLSPNQAVELLHDSIGGAGAAAAAASASPAAAAADPWPRLGLPLPRASPTFPSNAALVDRAARFSVFAAAAAAADADSSSPASSSGDPSPAAPPPPPPPRPSPAPKRKDPPTSSAAADKSKAKAKTKRSGGGGGGGGGGRSAEEDTGALEKLPYVHVRARRGQATDSHSLAERARREKINARMKLLQELVPGCSKISGTALVLDEIINHVQSLQRQVEFLSMRLAAVNPRVDFGGLDSFLSAECGRITGDNENGNGNGKNGAEEEGSRATWTDGGSDGVRRPHHHHQQQQQQQQQIWHVDLAHPHHVPSVWERGPGDAHGPHLFINPSSGVASLYGYDPSSASAPLQSNQLKTEL